MSLKPEEVGEIPAETVRVAQAAFPKGNVYMKMWDEFGAFYQDKDFEELFSNLGQRAETPWRLALVSVMQFAEGLSDRQTAEAVRARIDWKYALGLELTDEGFDYSILSEFRQRLITGSQEELLLDKMLEKFKAKGLIKARGKQRTDSTYVLAAVRSLNRLENLAETLRAALNELAETNPEWLLKQISAEWFSRYGRRIEDYRLPKEKIARDEYANQIGRDGFHILKVLDDDPTVEQLRELGTVKILRTHWAKQYQEKDGKVQLIPAPECPPSGERFQSPYDIEARFGNKGAKSWIGYKVHITESCDQESAHLITQVETTSAVTHDFEVTEKIQQDLEEKELLPQEHLVDGGYVNAEVLLNSKEKRAITVIGPVTPSGQWQIKNNTGFDNSQFQIDWDNKTVTCPAGSKTTRWYPMKDNKQRDWIKVRFIKTDCQACDSRSLCTKMTNGPRELRLFPLAKFDALNTAKKQQTTEQWKEKYKLRAGVEGTLSQAIRAFDLRQSRYIGLAKTHLQNILVAVAINVGRAVAWLNEIPLAKTRTSKFAALVSAV